MAGWGRTASPSTSSPTTNVGVNLLVFIPVFGSTTPDAMVDQMTSEIASEDGDTVRVIESSSENYWYGWPPLTWILTPVITSVSADYQPSAATLAADAAADAAGQ